MNRVALLLALLAALASQAGAESAPRPYIISIDDYPPYEYMEDGNPKGINAEVIQIIMDRLDIPVQFTFYPWARAWLLIEKGKIDAAPSVSHQTFRESALYFTDEQKAFNSTGRMPNDYLWMTEYVFFINRRFSDALRFESYEQIVRENYRVGVIKGYSYDQTFRDTEMNRTLYPTQEAAIRALAEGLIDVLPFDRTLGTYLIQRRNMEGQLTFLPRPMFQKPYLMGFSRQSDYPDQRKIMTRFYDELATMRRNGEYEAICRHYLATPIKCDQDRVFTFVCEDWAPFEYLVDNQVKGIDAEITEYIMGRLGLPYRIEIYPWSRAWMMAQKGSADAVLSVSYKASREPVLHYTQEQREFPETGEIPPDYLWLSEYVFFVKNQREYSVHFESYQQIKQAGYRVGINKDYSYDRAFRDAGLKGPVYNDTRAGFMALVAGEIDLYPMDKTVGRANLVALGLQDSVTFLPKPLFKKPYLAPFCKISDYPNIDNIMMAFNRELRLMRQSGEYKRIYDRYFKALTVTPTAPPP